MNSSFARLMTEASRLTRTGDLRGATAAIKSALAGGVPQRPESDGDVIDIEARDIRDLRDGAARPSAFPTDGAIPIECFSTAARPAAAAAAAGEFIAGSHTDAAGSRDYKLFVPPGALGQPLPLVVMLHGCTQNPDDFAAGTGMNEAALAQGFFVLYPAQTQGANPSRCWNWFKHNHQQRGRGEPALLAGMTRAVMARHSIDPKRVYVAGLSAGGAMAAILGDAYPDLFAAVGVHSGLPTGAARDVKSAFQAMASGAAAGHPVEHRPPTIVFHGDADSTVHPANGERLVRGRAEAAQRARSTQGRDYTRRVYRDADDRVVAEHWAVHGAGHAWSGGDPSGSYTDATGPDATAEMLRFFWSNRLAD